MKIIETIGDWTESVVSATVLVILAILETVADPFVRKGLKKSERKFNENLDSVILELTNMNFGGTYSSYRKAIDDKMEELGMSESDRLRMTRRIRFMERKHGYSDYRMQDFQSQLVKRLELERIRPPVNPFSVSWLTEDGG